MTRAVAVAALLASTSALAAAPAWDPSPEATPTVHVAISAASTSPTLVPLRVITAEGDQSFVETLTCGLMQGARSRTLFCRDLGLFPIRTRRQGRRLDVAIDLSRLSRLRVPWNIIAVEEDQTPDIQAAKARWVDGWFWDGWVCDTEITDIEACVSLCGGVFGVDDLSATPSPPNAPASSEPDCDVTCTCTDGTVDDWVNDPVTVIGPF